VQRPLSLAGLAITEDHYLAVGCVDPPGLLLFDLVSGGEPSFLDWPLPEFEPFALARRAGGGLWILDARNKRLWELERDFRIQVRDSVTATAAEGSFEPTEGEAVVPSETGGRRVADDDAIVVEGDPIALAAAGDGVLVLDRNPEGQASLFALYRRGRPTLTALAAGRETSVHGHALAFVPNAELGIAHVADDRGNQAFVFGLSIQEGHLSAELHASYFPMRLFGGKGLVVAPSGVLYDFAEGWIPLVHQPRARHVEAATIVTPTPPLDGGEPGCVWHRLYLDGCIEPGASVSVWSAAADDAAGLVAPEWQPEPPPRRRATGIEVAFAEALQGYDTYELLFQRARGRYLRIKLEFAGDGRVTPRIRALRASFPRFSYLERYLPGVYRDDPVSASFLDRFLANIEGFYTTIEESIAAAQVLFEPAASPSDALDWLAGWFDASLDAGWSDSTRRLFIRHAVDLFRRRGTPRGLELALKLGLEGKLSERDFAVDPRPGEKRARIVESFRARRTPGVIWGDPTDLGGPRVLARNGWTPRAGRVALDEAYRRYLERADESAASKEPYPITRPGGTKGEAWLRFSEETLGFVPGTPRASAEVAWHRFLARRYPNVEALNDAYGLVGDARVEAFGDVPWPDDVPPDGAPLLDWFEFSSVVLPMRRRAHRFTVLLPVKVGTDLPDLDPFEVRRRAERIVSLEKPAHTIFDVRFFWAAFRVGEARLGEDTLVDLGSRAPELLEPLVLGQEHLGESYLSGEPASDRMRRPSVASLPSPQEEQP
jgi:phage tail-like protein